MSTKTFLRVSLSAFVVLGGAVACSSSTATQPDAGTPACNEDPFSCPAGQTCWASDAAGSFACLNSGAGKKGDPCQNLIGSPTCSDGLVCLQLLSAASGSAVCVPYCDNANTTHACATGEACTKIAVVGSSAILHACVGPAATADAGADTGADAANPVVDGG
jgi:hypothetical protein